MKKIILSVLVIVLMLVLSACQEGIINSQLEITDTNGGGTKTITVHLYKDGADKVTGDGVVQKNSLHLPNGAQAVVDKLKAESALEDLVVEISESTDDYDVVSMSYSFSSIDEYNEKTEKLAKGAEIEPAAIEVDGDTVTFTENPANLQKSIQWALDAVYDDPDVYDPTGGNTGEPVSKEDFANLFDYVIIIGADSEKVDFEEARANETDIPSSVTVTGTIGEEPVEGDNETPVDENESGNEDNELVEEEENVPTAGENEEIAEDENNEAKEEDKKDSEDKESKSSGGKGIIIFLAVIVIAVIIFVVVRKRSAK